MSTTPPNDASDSPLSGRCVVVTGGAGFLGRRVVARLAERGVDVRAPRSSEFDLTVPGAAEAMLAAHEPSIVVHLAACRTSSRP